jgi:hypothetical protein
MTLGIKFSTHEFSGTLPSHGRMGMEGGNEVELEPTRWAGPGHALSLSLSLSLFFFCFCFLLTYFYFFTFTHMCIHCLGHFCLVLLLPLALAISEGPMKERHLCFVLH